MAHAIDAPFVSGRAEKSENRRAAIVALAMALAFATVAAQLVRLAAPRQGVAVNAIRPADSNFARPDIVDRRGRLVATDVAAPSLFADPALILDRDEASERLGRLFPDLDQAALRKKLSNRRGRFVWIKRGLAPAVAERAHNLGLPGLSFRQERRRMYPAGKIAGHVAGHVDADNRGTTGVERHIDEAIGAWPVHGGGAPALSPLRLSIDLGAQHALEEELRDGARRYEAAGAAGVVLDVRTGEILASASLPEADPARPTDALDPAKLDKVSAGAYELGSIWKVFTVAMALDGGQAAPESLIDVREPIAIGRFKIEDLHPAGRPLTVAEIFIRSSNVGAGLLARAAGPERQRQFLGRLGLLDPIATELGAAPKPLLPENWGELETVTISYGHGVAAAPIQIAAAGAALVNGGFRVAPTFLARPESGEGEGARVVSAETSAAMRDLMRLAVTDAHGTGRRADVDGYRVGGKTGTAEIARGGAYRKDAVVSSFLAAFPMDAPRYLVLVMLFEPKGTAETGGEITAGANAAPLAGRLVARISPLLGVLPAKD